MKKEFIPYEQALELKELGYDEPCFGVYYNDGELHIKRVDIQTHIDRYCLAPIFSQAFRWFREKHNLDSEIYLQHDNGIKSYHYLVLSLYNGVINWMSKNTTKFKNYEEAELECLKKLIEIVKNK